MNPPFAISPDKKFYFRDGGAEGDELAKHLGIETAKITNKPPIIDDSQRL
jgi:hypothetical protein